jgi:GT2 family glycosyltransferase
VVDDGSTMDLGSLVGEVAASGPATMWCERQDNAGLNAARNRGAQASTGDVLAFLDDDTLVSSGWVAALLRAFDDHPCAGVGGQVELGLEGPRPDWLTARWWYPGFLAAYNLGDAAHWISEDEPLPVGANCAVRRREFDSVDGFRPGLDRIGRSLVSNGDTEFFHRLRKAGGRLRYEPDALVTHCVPADRLTVRYFAKRHFAQGISDELLGALDGERSSWGIRVNHARFALRRARWLCGDLLHGRGGEVNWFEMHYWAGRCWAHRPRLTR